jgi:hypothetical protein
MILLFGVAIIGEQMFSVMGIPMILGFLAAVILIILLLHKITLKEFSEMEVIFRVLTIVGGILLIIIISLQIVLNATSLDIIPFLALIISTIGDMMSIICIYLLKKSFVTKGSLE